MDNNELKLAKVSAASDFKDLKALFNYNVDQISLFGGGAKGETGDTGSTGAQGDQGFCVYGDNNNDNTSTDIVSDVESKESDPETSGADIYINKIGVWSVSRGENRTAKLLFCWSQEDADGSVPYIIAKAKQAEQATQVTTYWTERSESNTVGLKKGYSKIVLVGDDTAKDTDALPDSCSDSPLTLYQDGSLSFVNKSNSNAVQQYVIHAAYNEKGNDPDKHSGIYMGQWYDSVFNIDPNELPYVLLDYNNNNTNITNNFLYTNTYVSCKGLIVNQYVNEEEPDTIVVATYKDINQQRGKGVVQGQYSIESSKSNLTLTIESNGDTRIEGIISVDELINGQSPTTNTNLKINTENIDFSNTEMNLKWGHVINSYGPEHIEFYGTTYEDLGIRGISFMYKDGYLYLNIMYYYDASYANGAKLITEYNNSKIYVNLTGTIDYLS